jgi:predicted Zn-dependent peptidase
VEVALLHDPQSTRIALAASVAAGSFHEPASRPGLAHFIEHCVFLGSAGLPGVADFADYVHAHGGRYNARTLALQTLYFLEMPSRELHSALKALTELLVCPLFVEERLQLELDVLDAEYRARCPDTAQQLLGAIAAQLHPQHPMSRFHAGTRETLQPKAPEFIAELRAWHARYYCGHHLRILISGPQPLDELERCARELLGSVPAGQASGAMTWPALWPDGQRVVELTLQQPQTVKCMSVWWPLDWALADQGGLLTLLRHALQQTARGSLLGELRTRGWAQQIAVRLEPASAHACLLVFHIDLLDGGSTRELEIAALCCDWLARFSMDAKLLPGDEEWRAICREQAWEEYEMAPLERAALWAERWHSQECEPWEPWPWHKSALAGLAAGLATVSRQRLIVQHACAGLDSAETTLWFPVRWRGRPLSGLPGVDHVQWQAPPPNPFLAGSEPLAVEQSPQNWRAENHYRQGLRPGHAALLLCWRGDEERAEAGLAAQLVEAALAVRWRQTLQAAVQMGCDWLPLSRPGQLRFCLRGPAALLSRVLSSLLMPLGQEQGTAWGEALQRQQAGQEQQMLLRRLLAHPTAQWWPAGEDAATRCPDGAGDGELSGLVQRFIRGAQLHSQCLGELPADVWSVLEGMGRFAPGPPPGPRLIEAGSFSHGLGMAGDEQAVLLRLLASRSDPRREAAWRMLATLWQGAFYQALRVEQGLGYAVFSRFHSGEDGMELQFGVQSPHAPAGRLQEAILAFLEQATAALPATPVERLRPARRAVVGSLSDAGTRRARLLRTCHAWLAAEPAGWAEDVRLAAQRLQLDDLVRAARELLAVDTVRCWVSST